MRAAGALTLATIAAAGLVAGVAGTANAASSHHVVYEIWGDAATATASWWDGDNDITSPGVTKTLPARIEVNNDSTYPIYGITAQTGGKGNISCRITVDGVVRDEETARGAYTVVSCNAE